MLTMALVVLARLVSPAAAAPQLQDLVREAVVQPLPTWLEKKIDKAAPGSRRSGGWLVLADDWAVNLEPLARACAGQSRKTCGRVADRWLRALARSTPSTRAWETVSGTVALSVVDDKAGPAPGTAAAEHATLKLEDALYASVFVESGPVRFVASSRAWGRADAPATLRAVSTRLLAQPGVSVEQSDLTDATGATQWATAVLAPQADLSVLLVDPRLATGSALERGAIVIAAERDITLIYPVGDLEPLQAALPILCSTAPTRAQRAAAPLSAHAWYWADGALERVARFKVPGEDQWGCEVGPRLSAVLGDVPSATP